MDIIDIKVNGSKYLKEYIRICSKEWSTPKSPKEMEEYVIQKQRRIFSEDKVISILGLIIDNDLAGFISLFKYDGLERCDLTPWYATMYVKEYYRGRGYSKILNEAIIKRAKELGYTKLFLKTNLINYYEKFGFSYIEDLPNGEKLYCLHQL